MSTTTATTVPATKTGPPPVEDKGPVEGKGPVEDTTPKHSDDTPKGEDDDKTFDAEYVKKLRAENASARVSNKELQKKADEYDKLQEDNKSELQKAQDAAANATKELEASKLSQLRAEVAADRGVPASLAKRLQGTTKEEMIADADAVLADLNTKYVAKAGASKQDTGSGVAGEGSNLEDKSPKELAAMIQRR
jgi:hypothetical protein